jgi:predicted metalloprotease with PDZ domain
LGKQQKGYTAKDYQLALENTSGISFQYFFSNYYYGTESYEPLLGECLEYLGYELIVSNRDNIYETNFGFKALKEGNAFVVKAVYPNSEAQQKGLYINDKIITVDNEELKELKQLNNIVETVKIKTVNTFLAEKEITLCKDDYYKKYTIERIHEMSEIQARNYAIWAGVVSL